MTANNPAAAAGWVKSQDPRSGRVFFANHLTRKTQWDPPSGWTEDDDDDDDKIGRASCRERVLMPV